MFRKRPADSNKFSEVQLEAIDTSTHASSAEGVLKSLHATPRPKLRQRHRRKLIACSVCLGLVLVWGGYAVGTAIDLSTAVQCLRGEQKTAAECFVLNAVNVSGLCSEEASLSMDLWVEWRAVSSVSIDSMDVQVLTTSGEELMTVTLLGGVAISSGSNDLDLEWGLRLTAPEKLGSTALELLEAEAGLTLRASVCPNLPRRGSNQEIRPDRLMKPLPARR